MSSAMGCDAVRIAAALCAAACFFAMPSITLAADQQHLNNLRSAKDALMYWVQKSPGDPLNNMPEAVQRALKKDPGLNIKDSLLQISEVEVREGELAAHLRALRADMDTVVLDPLLTALPFFPDFTFKVSRVSAALTASVNAALAKAVAGAAAAAAQHGQLAEEPAYIPYQVLDDLLAADLQRAPDAALTLYLVNPAPPNGNRPYLYTYSPADSSGHHWSCPSTSWAGLSPSYRYLWLDLAAGPPSFSPGPGRKGGVLPHSAPHPQHYRPKALPKALVPDLAALAWSATQHWVWPPLQFLPPADMKSKIIFQVIHMHDTLAVPSNKLRLQDLNSALTAAAQGLLEVEVHEVWLSWAMCTACVAAYSNALRVVTARNHDVYLTVAQQTQFLDSGLLHHSLARNRDAIFGDAGVRLDLDSSHRVLPVFLFHTSDTEQPLLLSEGQQAAAYPDMVIAVSSRASSFASSWTCHYQRHYLDSQDVTRPVLAAALTAAWGLANTSTAYTPAPATELNHMWLTGSTPFGPLGGQMAVVPGLLAALLGRNHALAQLNASIARLHRVLQGFQHLSRNGRWDGHSTQGHGPAILTRVNLARYKVQLAAAALGRSEYKLAVTFARSLVYEAVALERLALRISRTLEGRLECSSGPGLASVWWAPVAACASWPAAIWLRARLNRPKAEKYY